MRVAIMQAIITAVLSSFGIVPAWCNSCGEMYHLCEMSNCNVCGAMICPICSDIYGETDGCFVCNEDATVVIYGG